MKKWILLFVLLLAGCSASNEGNIKEKTEESHEVTVSAEDIAILAVNLKIPWSIDRVNDTFYISERTGSIVKLVGESQVKHKVELQKPLSTAAEAGLLGFVLAPYFTESKNAYA